MEGSGEGGGLWRYGGDGSDGWCLSGPHMSPVFLLYTCLNKQCKKYFYETMKYKKMNDSIFIFLCLHSKYFLRGFLRSVKIIYMGLRFLLCHDKNFHFIFSKASVGK
jgi:hypothetical protein